jgi:hypothetical protein
MLDVCSEFFLQYTFIAVTIIWSLVGSRVQLKSFQGSKAISFCVNDPKEAVIIWVSMQVDSEVKNALELTDQQCTNQFPFEACLVMRHHLAETIHKVSYQAACFVLSSFPGKP